MKNQKKLLLISSLVLLAFFLGIKIAIAATPAEALKGTLNKAFNWGFLIIGSLALLSFLYGALRYMTSVGGAGTGEGKDRMIGSILGIVLIVSSWLIMKTINPQIINLEFNALPPGAGVFLTGGSTLPKAVMSLEVPDISVAYKQGYKNISYECKGNFANLPRLLIWYYKALGKTSSEDKTFRIDCGRTQPINPTGSYVLGFETNGVYFFTNEGCSNVGSMSAAVSSSQNPISKEWQGKIKSARIVANFVKEDPASGIGILFHQSPDLREGGGCQTGPYAAFGGETCVKWSDIKFFAYSLDIFTMPKDPKLSGRGLTIYTKNSGELQTQQAGYFNVNPEDLPTQTAFNPKAWSKKASEIKFSYFNVLQPKGENCPDDPSNTSGTSGPVVCPCPTFEKEICHSGSIQFKGDYLVMLFSKPKTSPASGDAPVFCQSFIRSVDNLGTESFVKKGGEYIFDKVVIEPIIP